jgi:predicted metal-dependent enzyme (double-stranded beta helix superfamily)
MNRQIVAGKMGRFVEKMNDLLLLKPDEEQMLNHASIYLGKLVEEDDWLPESCTIPHPEHYQQYLLYRDPEERFSVVSFVWGPGQKTPVHDHTVWGLIGMLRGGEVEQRFEILEGKVIPGETHELKPGDVGLVSPTIGDVHQVANASQDEVSISVHVYGADIGKVSRHVYTETGETKTFISGYTNNELPDLY